MGWLKILKVPGTNMAQTNKTFTRLMCSRVQNVTTWSAIFALSEPGESVYATLCLPKDTKIDVQRCLALGAAGPKQYLFMDSGGKTNIINILNLYIQPNQNPLVLAALGDNYKSRTYVHFNQNLLVSKIITIMPSNEVLVLNYPKHDVELTDIYLPVGANDAASSLHHVKPQLL